MSGRPRATGYAVVGTVLVLVHLLVRGSEWRGSEELHTLFETATAFTALIVGVIAILQFYAHRTTAMLFAGAAFSGTAILDALHAGIASSFSLGTASDVPEDLVTWSWFVPRLYLSVMMAARGWTWSGDEAAPLSDRRVFGAAATLVAALIAGELLLPLPPAQVPGFLIGRPQELVPGVLFAYALVAHLRTGAWKQDGLEHALVVSLILAVATQWLFMPFSVAAYDAMFDVAHVLKLLTIAVALAGLLAAALEIFQRAERQYQERTFGFLDNLPVGVFITDAKGKPYYANGQAVRILGPGADPKARPEDLADVYRAYVVGSNEAYPAGRVPLVRALRGERSVVTDLEIRGEAGPVPLQVSGAPIVDKSGKVVYAIAAFQDIRELRRAALEDPLTRLVNRLGFQEAYTRITGVAWRAGQSVCVAAIDLDRFKSVNDRYGHGAGDEVLRRAAEVISRAVRTSDVVARWGGEEFAVLLPGTDLGPAVAVIERALESLRREIFPAEAGSFSVTFSAGVVPAPPGSTVEESLAEADRLLYRAKEGGRNRVCCPREGEGGASP